MTPKRGDSMKESWQRSDSQGCGDDEDCEEEEGSGWWGNSGAAARTSETSHHHTEICTPSYSQYSENAPSVFIKKSIRLECAFFEYWESQCTSMFKLNTD